MYEMVSNSSGMSSEMASILMVGEWFSIWSDSSVLIVGSGGG